LRKYVNDKGHECEDRFKKVTVTTCTKKVRELSKKKPEAETTLLDKHGKSSQILRRSKNAGSNTSAGN
jgi:hypothetical protein